MSDTMEPDMIERLVATEALLAEKVEENLRLRDALLPFAKILGPGTNMRLLHVPDSEVWKDGISYTITYGDLRRAMYVFSE